MTYAPLVFCVHLFATFFVLANLAVRNEAVFQAVRAGLLVLAAAAALQAPVVGAYLLVPVIAANPLRRVRVPDFVDPSWAA